MIAHRSYRVRLALLILVVVAMQCAPVFALRASAMTNALRPMNPRALFITTALAETTTVTGTVVLTVTTAVTGTPSLSPTVALTTSAVSKGSLIVGSSSGAMQQFLGQTFILLLREAGYQVIDKTNLGDTATVRAALEGGQIDLAPEALGTALVLFHKLPVNTLPATPERLYILAKTLDAQQGLALLPALTISNTNTLVVSPSLVDKGIKTSTALADYMKANDAPLKLCAGQEFANGEAGSFLKGLEQQYGFQFKLANVLVMETAKTYEALNNGQCDVAEGAAIDSRLSAWHLQPLADDRAFFMPDNQAPVIRQSVLTAHPELANLLGALQGRLDPQTLTQLHARFMLGIDGKPNSGDEETPQAVAYSFLRSQHLLKPPKIAVGAEDYTEQLILGQMMILLLADAGYPVEDKTGIGGTKALQVAMEQGDIDVYAEYGSQALTVRHAVPVEAIPTDGEKIWTLAKTLDERKGIIWLAHSPFNDAYTFMVRDDLWNKGVKTLPDLANYIKTKQADLSLCLENDFFSRQYDGLPAVEAAYDFQFQPDKVQLMDLDAVYTSLRKQTCDVGEGYRTDGRGAAWNFHNLADPLAVFGVAQVAPLIRKPVLEANPDLTDILGKFVLKLDDATMSQLNARVDIGKDGEPSTGDEETPQAVAYSFLRSQHLLKPPKIAVGAEDYTEQLILGQMMILLLADAGYPVEDKTGIGGTKALQAAMENGDIDVYAEYGSQALTVRHAVPIEAIPTDGEKIWTLAKTLDERKGIIWLAHSPFNDAYTFMVRDDLWNKGVKTLPDLANYIKTKQADLSLCLENDFFSRQYDGLPAVEAAYDFQFQPDKVQLMDLDAVYTSLRKQTCDVGEGYRTDGRGAAWNFHNLADPLAVFGVAQVAPLIRKPVLEANPDLTDVLGKFVLKLDDATMSQLNARVDIGKDDEPSTGDEETPQAVAQDFLTKAGFLHTSNSNADSAATVNAPKATSEKQ